MKLIDYHNLLMDFLSLKPDSNQVFNSIKYGLHYFLFARKPILNYTPISVGFYITYKCNLRCEHCWNKCINQEEYLALDITVDEFRKYMTHAAIKNAFRVSYVGGEPLTHPHLFDFIRIAWQHNKLSMFPSNGLLIKKRIDEFRESPLHTIQVSIYEEHLAKQVENVRLLRKANSGVDIVLSHWVTKKTYRSIEDIIRMADDFGVRKICIQNYIPVPGSEPSEEQKEWIIWDSDKDVLEYFHDIDKRYSRKYQISFPAPLTRDRNKRFCIEPHTVIFVGKNGVVCPCSTIVPPSEKYGSLEDVNVWNSECMVGFRRDFTKNFPVDPQCEYCYSGSNYHRPFI